MQLITHKKHVDQLPSSSLKAHIQARFQQLSEETDVPPTIIPVEPSDDVNSTPVLLVAFIRDKTDASVFSKPEKRPFQ